VSTTIEEAFVELRVKFDTLDADLRKANASVLKSLEGVESQTRRTATSIEKSFSAVGSVFAKAFAGISVGLVTRQLVQFARTTVQTASDIKDTADALGVGTVALQEMREAAKLAGISVGEFDTSLRFALRAASKELGGLNQVKDAFGIIGLTLNRIDLQNPAALFEKLGVAVANLANSSDQAAKSQIVFGRGSERQVNLFKDQAREWQKNIALAKEYGIALDDNGIQKLEQFGDKMELFNDALKAKFQRFLTDNADSLLKFADAALKAVNGLASLVDGFTVSKQEKLEEFEKLIARNGKILRDLSEELARAEKAAKTTTGIASVGAQERLKSLRERFIRENALLNEQMQQAAAMRAELEGPGSPPPPAGKIGGTGGIIDKEGQSKLADEMEKERKQRGQAILRDIERQADAAKQADDNRREALDDIVKLEIDALAAQKEYVLAVEKEFDIREQQLEAMHEAGSLSEEELKRAKELLGVVEKTAVKQAEKQQAAENPTLFDRLSKSFEDFDQQVADAFGEWVRTGEDAFKSLGKAFIEEFVEVVIEEMTRVALELAKLGIGKVAGAAGITIPGLASGGVVTRPGIFALGERGPEAVIPLSGARSSSSGTVVQVFNSTGEKVSVDRKRGGATDPHTLRIMVGDLVVENLERGGSIAQAMERKYGASRRGF
jgi:hypothetical protein